MAAVALAGSVVAGQLPVVLPPAASPGSSDFLTHDHFDLAEVIGTLNAYHDAVRQYRHGDAERAMMAVRGLPPRQVEFVIETLRDKGRIASTNPEQREYLPFNWPRDDLAAAGVLLGDITIADVGLDPFERELRLTLSVLGTADAVRPDGPAAQQAWTRDWLRATGNLLLAHGQWRELSILLTYVSILFPKDGPLLLVRGTMDELQSGAAASPGALTYPEGFARMKRDRDVVQQDAIRALSGAVQARPISREAEVRLAHVFVQAHQDARAAPLLDRVLTSNADRWWLLAALLRGGVYEQAGQAAAAERLYREAIDRFPRAQSPYLALAMLQTAAGKRDESAATFDRMYGRPTASDDDDPWWDYGSSMWSEGETALKGLRAQVRQ